MKIITLVENRTENPGLFSEHGLSLYIETEKYKILFDTGKTDLFIQNAKVLDIDLSEIDFVVISHGHYDHIGGLIHFLKLNQKAKVFLKKEIFENHYFSIRGKIKKNISFPNELINFNERFVFADDQNIIVDTLFFISTFVKNYNLPKGNEILYKLKDNMLTKDDFQHELIFVVKSLQGLVIFCGCAHNGILNTVSTVRNFFVNEKINTVIGGFHLVAGNEFINNETDTEIRNIALELKQLTNGATFYTGHCTCEKSFAVLSTVLNTQIRNLKTGSFIEIEE